AVTSRAASPPDESRGRTTSSFETFRVFQTPQKSRRPTVFIGMFRERPDQKITPCTVSLRRGATERLDGRARRPAAPHMRSRGMLRARATTPDNVCDAAGEQCQQSRGALARPVMNRERGHEER